MGRKEDIKLVIFADEKHEPKTLSIKRRSITLLVALAVIILVLNIIGAVSYFKLVKIAVNFRELRGENQVLIEQLQKLNDIEEQFIKIKKYNQKIREIIGHQIEFSTIDETDSLTYNLKSAQSATVYNTVPKIAPVSGYISREFDAKTHPALDIAAKEGSPVLATANGRVVFSGWTQDFGNSIVIFHGNGFFSVYKHNLRNTVSDNEFVSAGQVIALLGGTGEISSGPHLHFEIWKIHTPVDPLNFVSFK